MKAQYLSDGKLRLQELTGTDLQLILGSLAPVLKLEIDSLANNGATLTFTQKTSQKIGPILAMMEETLSSPIYQESRSKDDVLSGTPNTLLEEVRALKAAELNAAAAKIASQ